MVFSFEISHKLVFEIVFGFEPFQYLAFDFEISQYLVLDLVFPFETTILIVCLVFGCENLQCLVFHLAFGFEISHCVWGSICLRRSYGV